MDFLFLLADPSLVLPALVGLLYSSDEALQSSASNTFVAVLKYHNKSFEVLCMLFNCLRYILVHLLVLSSYLFWVFLNPHTTVIGLRKLQRVNFVCTCLVSGNFGVVLAIWF